MEIYLVDIKMHRLAKIFVFFYALCQDINLVAKRIARNVNNLRRGIFILNSQEVIVITQLPYYRIRTYLLDGLQILRIFPKVSVGAYRIEIPVAAAVGCGHYGKSSVLRQFNRFGNLIRIQQR